MLRKLKYISSVVAAFFIGSSMSAHAAVTPVSGLADQVVSKAARDAIAQKLDPGAARIAYFAQDKGPSWVNSPKHIKRGESARISPYVSRKNVKNPGQQIR